MEARLSCNRSEFSRFSYDVQFFLRHFCNSEDEATQIYWLNQLAVFGPAADQLFTSLEADLVSSGAAISTLAPWKDDPQRTITGTTAHECAALFMQCAWSIIFKERPTFEDLSIKEPRWVQANLEKLRERVAKLDEAVNYQALLVLAAEIGRERALMGARKAADPKVQYSTPKSPKDWARIFGYCWDTLKDRIDNGDIKAERINSKSYKICVDDLPLTHPEHPSSRKQVGSKSE